MPSKRRCLTHGGAAFDRTPYGGLRQRIVRTSWIYAAWGENIYAWSTLLLLWSQFRNKIRTFLPRYWNKVIVPYCCQNLMVGTFFTVIKNDVSLAWRGACLNYIIPSEDWSLHILLARGVERSDNSFRHQLWWRNNKNQIDVKARIAPSSW